MINPNQLGRRPFPASASQWMLVGLRGSAVAPPFDPNSITGLKVWVKADSLALADGATVTAWNDSSPAGYNLQNAGTPIYKTNIVNGKPVVRFNGTDAAMYGTGAAVLGVSQPNTIFAVGSVTAPDGAGYVYTFGTGGQVVGINPITGTLSLFAGSYVADAVNHAGAFHVLTGIFSTSNATGYVDGVFALGPTATGANGIGVFGMMNNFAGNAFKGDVAEALVYDSALNATDRGNVETYLKTKYAIA